MSRPRRSWPSTIHRLLCDVVTLTGLALMPRAQLATETLFLRKQLALYQERCVRPRRPDPATRLILVLLSRLLAWRSPLTVVQPATLIRWHRQGWRLFWRWKSRPGRPPIPAQVQRLIVSMARANPTWSEEWIANELRLKLGLTVSPRTVGRYLRTVRPGRGGRQSRRWATFVRNHAHAVVACDFFTTVTVAFASSMCSCPRGRHASDPLLQPDGARHGRVDDPAVSRRHDAGDVPPFVLHDRDSIYAATVDRAIASMGRHVLKTPVRTSQANAFCERLIGTIRRECLDWLIPIHEKHLRWILREWVAHYNRGRPHASLGPGIPDPWPEATVLPTGHQLAQHAQVIATPILNGLHHEYHLAEAA
jgi:putative transposase